MSKDVEQKFIDGAGEVYIQDGMLRFDLFALSATQRNKDGDPIPEIVTQLVMSPRGFGRLATMVNETMKRLQQTGGEAGKAASEGAAEPTPEVDDSDKPARGKAKRKKKRSVTRTAG